MPRFPGDPWATLGVKPGSDRNAIKSQFRKLALELHPDTCKNPTAETAVRFAAVSQAAERLLKQSDEELRNWERWQYQTNPAGRHMRTRRVPTPLLLGALIVLTGFGVLAGFAWVQTADNNQNEEGPTRAYGPDRRRGYLAGAILRERQMLEAQKRATEGH